MGKQPPKRSSRTKSSPQQTDAVQILKADHKQVKKLFERFWSAAVEERTLIAKQLFTELEIHTKLEEELFYPAIRSKLEPAGLFDTDAQENGLDVVDLDEDTEDLDAGPVNGTELNSEEEEETDEELITVAYEEHQVVKELIGQLKTLDPNGADFRDVFSELEEAVITHVTEEEDLILPIAASELDTQALGAKMQRRRDDLSSLAA